MRTPLHPGPTRRLLASSALAILLAGGAGLLTAGFTMQPPTPPQPATIDIPAAPSAAPTTPPKPTDSPVAGLARSEPVKVEIPSINVKADIIALGVTAKNELEVPDIIKQPMLAGWYKLGPSPGEIGNALIVGHVDSEKIGPAVFFNLGKLKPGDLIKVSRKDGTTAQFKVDGAKTYPKSEFPADVVYGWHPGPPKLYMVTCGGELDKKNKTYLSNVVVSTTLTP